MKVFSVIAFLLICATLSANEDAFERANAAYKAGQYAEAIEHYQEVLHTGEFGPALFNLGNAYYKAGDIPKAILYYEKALKQAPNDQDIQHNLAIANLKVIDKIEAKPEFFLITWWKDAARKFKSDQWAIGFLILLWVGILSLLALAFLNIRRKGMVLAGGITFLLGGLLFLLLALTQHRYESNDDHAIIQSASVSVKSAPVTSGTDLFIIHQGLKVRVIQSEGDWQRIHLADGKEGWVHRDHIAII